MDKMPLPKFYGEVRYHPRFKRDFYELVVPNLSNRESAFALRQCLGKEVDNILGSGDCDVEQMFKRLDEKDGDPGKMTDSIICEKDGDPSKMTDSIICEKDGDPSKMTDTIICEIQRIKRIENDD